MIWRAREIPPRDWRGELKVRDGNSIDERRDLRICTFPMALFRPNDIQTKYQRYQSNIMIRLFFKCIIMTDHTQFYMWRICLNWNSTDNRFIKVSLHINSFVYALCSVSQKSRIHVKQCWTLFVVREDHTHPLNHYATQTTRFCHLNNSKYVPSYFIQQLKNQTKFTYLIFSASSFPYYGGRYGFFWWVLMFCIVFSNFLLSF